jgi:adenylate kinase family enzyme
LKKNTIEGPKRIQIAGSSCSGKTTLAKKVSQILKIPHVELDALHWEPGWKEADLSIFKSRVSNAIQTDSWVVDGHYTGKIGNLVTDKVNIILWIDLSFATILRRFFARSLKRSWTGEILWNGCRENLRNSIFKRDSLLVWILSTHKSRRAKYLSMIDAPQNGVKIVRLQSNQEIEDFLSALRDKRF